jgi:ABC-type thiamin/hydroxymethylpyrimidine transport system permease subunit
MPDGWLGVPRTPRAAVKLVGTAVLAGLVGGSCSALAAHALGLSTLIAGSVSGVAAALAVGLSIARHGPGGEGP